MSLSPPLPLPLPTAYWVPSLRAWTCSDLPSSPPTSVVILMQRNGSRDVGVQRCRPSRENACAGCAFPRWRRCEGRERQPAEHDPQPLEEQQEEQQEDHQDQDQVRCDTVQTDRTDRQTDTCEGCVVSLETSLHACFLALVNT